jgi:hypothetical protein
LDCYAGMTAPRNASAVRSQLERPFESGLPEPATQEVDSLVNHSAVVALRRLSHPERDGGVVAEDGPVFQPERLSHPERDGAVDMEDPISQLFKRLSRDMPELMEEVVTFIERRTAELNEGLLEK